MRLRKKPWIEQAILEHSDLVILDDLTTHKGNWQKLFPTAQPLCLEIGTGRGSFIVGMAQKYPERNFIGIEANLDVLYDVVKKVRDLQLPNIRLIRDNAISLTEWFAPAEIETLYLNFSDPWPKNRHAKRRLTHNNFLKMYQQILKSGNSVHFKTDNDQLFAFTLEELATHNYQIKQYTTDLYNSSIPNSVATEYEQKFVALGKNINYCEFTLSI